MASSSSSQPGDGADGILDVRPMPDMELSNNEGKSGQRSGTASVLGALPLLRSSKYYMLEHADANGEIDTNDMSTREVRRGSSIATASQKSHGRRRKGSLRQAALAKLGSSSRKERTSTSAITTTVSTPSPEEKSRNFFDSSTATIDSQKQLQHQDPRDSPPTLSRVKAPYPSTTDEEEMSLNCPPTSTSSSSLEHPSYMKATSLSLRRSHRSVPQIFAPDSSIPDELDIEDDWDYSETEWWGWVILIATWIVFVVVIGSCFGVWSWAWDVGETPYAPPDLEDDDTLPITGYYPALMVCTAVMSWVWVVVAWVGMQYFRYSKR